MKLGLIGKTLTHSWSQWWFEQLFRRDGIADAEYRLYPMPSLDGLRDWALREGLSGFNVTIPYKEAIIPLLDRLDDEAQTIGAVNCVAVQDGQLVGYNTDSQAFRETLQLLMQPCHTHALVLGTGGASRAVGHALSQLGIAATFVSRTPDGKPSTVGYTEAEGLMATHLLVVNATPVGMYPDKDATPWQRADLWTPRHLCYDLIYNPSPTRLLQEAADHGASTRDGLPMLFRQAELSWKRFSTQ